MIKTVLDFVEIRTKLASVLPLFTGTLYALTQNYTFSYANFALMIASLLLIDMTTTGLNNYYDYKRSILKSGYHYDHHNPISAGKLSLYHSKLLLFAFFTLAVFFGILLVMRTHLGILYLGMLSFGVALAYSMGPLPISRTPFGELVSGGFMGILIPLISGYIYMPMSDLMTLNYTPPFLSLGLNLRMLFSFCLMGLPLFFTIANIMLANNTCDIEEDIVNARRTLPVVMGKAKSCQLFTFNFYMAYASLLLNVSSHVVHPITLLTLVTLYKTRPLARVFVASPSKRLTFVNAVKIFFIFALCYNITLALSLCFR